MCYGGFIQIQYGRQNLNLKKTILYCMYIRNVTFVRQLGVEQTHTQTHGRTPTRAKRETRAAARSKKELFWPYGHPFY